MPDLKLLALDHEDLEVISAFCQDAVVRVEDIGFSKEDARFALLMNRYSWEDGENARSGVRKRTAMRFEHVLDIKSQGINLEAREGVLELLAISFTQTQAPAGDLKLVFAGGAEITLKVDCLEARLNDFGAAWAAKAKPSHQV